MAIRFRKSIKLAPGVRWNLSGSWTLGVRGASINVGKQGAFLNAGIPGSGISARTRLSGASRPGPSPNRPATERVSLTCRLLDDGNVTFLDADAREVSAEVAEQAKAQSRDAILEMIETRCKEINDQVDAIGSLHLDTPAPNPPRFVEPAFPLARPEPRIVNPLKGLDKLIPGRRRALEDETQAEAERFKAATAQWEAERAQFEIAVSERRHLIEKRIYEDVSAMEGFLQEYLTDIAWPRETQVSFEFGAEGRTVAVDVDLPEEEHMPRQTATVSARGLKVLMKDISHAKRRKLYAEHVHGILFRVAGEVFACVPTAQLVTVAGYSQRRDPGTARLSDEYLLSVRILRPEWNKLDFHHLQGLDVVQALERFELRRDMSKGGMFKTIEPHVVPVA